MSLQKLLEVAESVGRLEEKLPRHRLFCFFRGEQQKKEGGIEPTHLRNIS